MNALKSALETQPCFESTMIWAACCVGFFGFLRCGEFTVPSTNAYNKERHLSITDVAADSHTSPSTIAIRIKFSKTDQFGLGTTIYLGRTSDNICPVSAVLQYLVVTPSGEGPLFVTSQGTPQLRQPSQGDARPSRIGYIPLQGPLLPHWGSDYSSCMRTARRTHQVSWQVVQHSLSVLHSDPTH